MRGRMTAAVVVLAVLDLVVIALGYRAHSGSLPPFQRTTESFEVTDSPTGVPTDVGARSGISAPLLLGVNPSGVVLRATRGACDPVRQNPAQVWVGNLEDSTPPALVEPGVREVLGLMVYADGSLRITGLDGSCKAMTVDSHDGGDSWQSSPDAGIWRLSPDTTAASIIGPKGSDLPTQCAPSQLLNLPQRRGIASCSSGTFFPLVPGQQPVNVAAGDFRDLSVAPGSQDGHYYVFGRTSDCAAQVADVKVADNSVTNLLCLGNDRAPLAIATAADSVVVQVGDDLMVSDDGGEHFAAVG